MRRRLLLGCVLAGLLALSACGNSGDTGGALEGTPEATATATASAAPATVTGTVKATDQKGDGKTLEVDSVTINGANGFIAVHKDANNAPGAVVGHVAVKQGTAADVVVTLDTPQATGAFWPMLHVDSPADGEYKFPPDDKPVTEASGTPVMMKITLTVGSGV